MLNFGTGIGFHYNVSDLERTIAFYTEKLGLCVLDVDTERRQARMTTNVSGCILGFAQAENVVPASACITFEVRNMEEAVRMLRQNGAASGGEIMEVPNTVKLFAFADPDGYSLMLYEQIGRKRREG